MSNPIGIFDSGIGGLTVARAIRRILPNEPIVYFGDTAHLPYGDKSEAAIQAYSVKIADVLLKKNCKAIVIACNSASASAYQLLQEYAGKRTKIINVIDPMVQYTGEHYANQKIGLIGTKRTISSQVYGQKIANLGKGIELASLATPLLVPMIEEGFFHQKISHDIIEEYLSHAELENMHALILGCTHYPLIKDEIFEFLQGQVEVLDSSEITAQHLKTTLEAHNLVAQPALHHDQFLVSDFTESFESSTKLFFGERVHLEYYHLWE